MTKRVELVFRTVGERTSELALELAKRHVQPTRVHVIDNVRPFAKAVDRMLEIEHDCDSVVHMDADCLILEDMAPFLQANEAAYVDSFVADRFRGRIHCGVHITRIDVVRQMKREHTDPSNIAWVLRPESSRRNRAIERLGFEKAFRTFRILHDHCQWYEDVFHKYALRELRSRTPVQQARLRAAMRKWDEHPDFRVARAAVEHAHEHVPQDAPPEVVHEYIEALPEVARAQIEGLSLPPQGRLTMDEVDRAADEAFVRERPQVKVFGIGLSRTGTRSLTSALGTLGFDVVHYPTDERTFEDLAQGRWDLHLLEHYDGITDITVAPYYAQLHRRYPDAKFILTTRDRETWLKSCRNHWTGRDAFEPARSPEQQSHMKIRRLLRAAVYGTYAFDEERFTWAYEQHVRSVREYFADHPGSLLEMDIVGGDGWDELCAFLGRPVPEQPFPHKGFKLSLKMREQEQQAGAADAATRRELEEMDD